MRVIHATCLASTDTSCAAAASTSLETSGPTPLRNATHICSSCWAVRSKRGWLLVTSPKSKRANGPPSPQGADRAGDRDDVGALVAPRDAGVVLGLPAKLAAVHGLLVEGRPELLHHEPEPQDREVEAALAP